MPQLAVQHGFLMHSVLAIAALHLARQCPQRRKELIIAASSHETAALPLFRSQILDISQHNCEAVFACSSLVVVYAMACPQPFGSLLFAGSFEREATPDWLHLLRGICSILASVRPRIESGPLAPLLKRPKHPIEYSNNPNDWRLVSLYDMLPPPSPTSSSQTQQEHSVYCTALELLRRSSSLPYLPCKTHDTKSAVYSWPIRVPQAYITLLSARRPEALVLLAYQCVLLKQAEPCWHMDGQARRLISIIYEDLDVGWRHWIEWPLQVIGFDAMYEPV